MKQIILRALIAITFFMPISAFAQKSLSIESPDGVLHVEITLDGELSYKLTHENDVLISPSAISMSLKGGEVLGKEPRVKKVQRKSCRESIYPPIYKKATIDNHYNELTIWMKGNYGVVFRAYNDGMAYRFITRRRDSLFVEQEQARFNLPDNPTLYMATPRGRNINGEENQYHSSFQNVYRKGKLSEWDNSRLAFLPVLAERAHGKKLCLTEADLLNYPGMYVRRSTDNQGLEGHFAAYPRDIDIVTNGLKEIVKSRESYIAKVPGATAFPWRVAVVSSQDKELLANDMVYKLAKPAPEGDYSWIKPGKVAWDWWNNWNLYGVDFESGVNNATYKYYIDFASKHGIEYVILDEGWSVPGKADLFQIVPEIDLKELIAYASQRKVGLILWAGYRAFNKDMDNVCRHYAAMGIKGFKIDFMDRDDQYMVDFNRRCAETGLKYKLLIDLHGTHKPTGLQRTYPNAINFEGVFGLEEMKWAEKGTDQVTYDVTMPFIRMVAGPVDYTQGAMNNAIKQNFRAVYAEPMSQGTRCRQMAEYVVFDSPLNMLCDSPSNYEKEEECTRFIASVPTVWDETIPLDGKIGEYIAIARRKGDVWYVGVLTNWSEREMQLDLSFLKNNAYKMECFVDGPNATKVGKDYRYKTGILPSDKKLNVHMAPGGGCIIKLW